MLKNTKQGILRSLFSFDLSYGTISQKHIFRKWVIRLPEPVRDSYSGALIFIPTAQEQMYMESKRALDRELAEVRDLKAQLQAFLENTKQGIYAQGLPELGSLFVCVEIAVLEHGGGVLDTNKVNSLVSG